MYLVNVPWIFGLCWRIVKPWVPDASIAKITICGDNWKEVLKQNFEAENLPSFLGGTCECKDKPLPPIAGCTGGCIPEIEPEAGYTEQKLAAGTVFTHTVKVPESGSLLSWEFRTRKYDIGFSIGFEAAPTTVTVTVTATATDGKSKPKPAATQSTQVTTAGHAPGAVFKTYTKTDASAAIQSGVLECKTAGTYTLVWDNSYSWMTAKELLYHVDVTAPIAQTAPEDVASPAANGNGAAPTATATATASASASAAAK